VSIDVRHTPMNPIPKPTIVLLDRRRASGATLIEVLVAIVVLAIGLLGLAGLQMTSLQSNYSAMMRTKATLLAYDLTDRMRARRQATLTGAYDNNATGDRETWNTSVTQSLGTGAQGSVTRVGRDVTITIQWNDNRGRIKGSNDTTTSSTETFTYRTEI